jgi:long-subunit fatty acid transport protein
VDIDLEADLGDLIRTVFDEDTPTSSSYDLEITDLRFPQQLGLAWMTSTTNFDRLHFQATWTQWSETFDGWTANLNDGTNDTFNEMMGGDGSTSMDLDNEWRDSFLLSFGWEHDWVWTPAPWARRQTVMDSRVPEGWDITSRLGLGWSTNPVSGSSMPGLMPFNQWHVGGGLSLKAAPFGGNWNLGFVVALPETVKVGENSVLSDLSNDSYRQSNYAVMLGYSLTW